MPVGEPISGNVIDQIKAREALFSSTFREDDKLKYLSSRNAWVRVVSFVNKSGSAELSENFVLSSVASAHTGSEENPGFSQYSGVNFNPGSNSNSFYSTTDRFGTRPRPGITSFNIKSKNSGGTIQLAEIGFVVWNEDDLDTIEQLYLRLGFEVMVEWGHTLYIDNEGELQEYNDPDYNTFFDDVVYESTVKRHIRTNRDTTYNNADGFLGYITNFSWSFRQDGAYECSIKVISAGAVIESLLGKVGSSEKSNFLIEECYITDFHSLYNLSKQLVERRIIVNNEVSITREPNIIRANSEVTTQELGGGDYGLDPLRLKISELGSGENLLRELESEFGNFFRLGSGIPLGVVAPVYVNSEDRDENIESNKDFGSAPVFFPLRYCLALINSIIKRVNRKGSVLFHLSSNEKFLRSENLVVVKPLKALILTEPTLRNPILGTTEKLYYKAPNDLAKSIKFRSVSSDDLTPVDLIQDEILNIFVNLEVFVRNIDSLRESNPDESTIDIFTLVTKVLEEINQSVSYGIDLGIIYDEEIGKFKVIDRGRLPSRSDTRQAPILQISGTSTTVSSLSLTSKVTNKLGNQISIAAQTNPASYPASVIKYREWNQDLTSRLRRISVDGISLDDAGTVTHYQRSNYFVNLIEQYKKLNEERYYTPEEWESITTYSQVITQEGIDNDPNIPKGLIPIELSFTMDGIAGLKQLQSFKVPPTLLPKKYNNDYVGFIINGLEHTIENNKWFTQVRAQMYLIRGKVPIPEDMDDLYRNAYLFSQIPTSYFERANSTPPARQLNSTPTDLVQRTNNTGTTNNDSN